MAESSCSVHRLFAGYWRARSAGPLASAPVNLDVVGCPLPLCENARLVSEPGGRRMRCPSCDERFADPGSITSEQLNQWLSTGLSSGECLYLEAVGVRPSEAAE